jgi:hypothetical protein
MLSIHKKSELSAFRLQKEQSFWMPLSPLAVFECRLRQYLIYHSWKMAYLALKREDTARAEKGALDKTPWSAS